MAIQLDANRICRDGQAIYDRDLRDRLEPEHDGRYVAVEIETGEYFLGDTGGEALVRAREKHPEKLFFLARVGRRAAHFHRGVRQSEGGSTMISSLWCH